MKKILYAILLGTIFLGIGSSDVKADEFDYNTCTINCRNAGDQYNNCMAGCDARKLVEEKKLGCSGNSLCIEKWENSFPIKLEYYIEYYTNSSNGFNYSRFDYDTCYFNCNLAGSSSGACKADCQAREYVQDCIIYAKTSSEVINCKNGYSSKYEYYLKENGVISSGDIDYDTFDYKKCSEECGTTECRNKCYANMKVQECLNNCPYQDSGCSRGCKESYNYYYNQVTDTSSTYAKIKCGDGYIPYIIPQIVRTIIVILQIATPLIIIFLGSLDLVKAVMAQKDDEIKKGQQTFIRRLVIGALVFLVFFVVEMIIGIVAPKNENYNMWNCVDCFVNGDCNIE